MHAIVPSLLVLLLPALAPAPQLAGASAAPRAATPPLERLLVGTADSLGSGRLVELHGPPWQRRILAPTAGVTRVRSFDGWRFAVDPAAGTVLRVPADGSAPTLHDLGPASEPQDVCVTTRAGRAIAWVTRRNDPRLVRIDLASGAVADAVDLSPVGAGSPIQLGWMERDGTRLFVQVRVIGIAGMDTGVLAVVHLPSEGLLDVEPLLPGIQGVALEGAPPRLRMQVVPRTRTLFVSTTDAFLDGRGGIEMVDLDALVSVGFALRESEAPGDVGGFVLTGPDAGYYVFHTDFAASTHLATFTVRGGPVIGPEIFLLFGDLVDALAHDPVKERLFLPSGFAGGPIGVWEISTRTQQVIGGGPIPTGERAHDVEIVR